MRYDAVIFDNDGVLVEPTDLSVLRGAIRSTFVEHGVDEPTEVDVDALIRASVDSVRDVCERHDIGPAEFWEMRDTSASRAQQAEIRAGRKAPYDDVDALGSIDGRLGVVSNNQQETVDFIVEYFGFGDLFETVYGREPTIDGIRRKKPNPYYLEAAIEDLGAERALYVGDSNVDVAAAESVGIDSAFVRRPHRNGYELASDPTYEIDSLADLFPLVRGESDPFRV